EDPSTLHPVRVARQLAKLADPAEPVSGHPTNPLDLEDLPGLGMRVLLVDFDPQGHLTKQLGQQPLPIGGDSLTCHMAGEAKGPLQDLIAPIQHDRLGDR
ncbi:ParA family protein, partial [Streptomyces katrae]